MAPKSLSPAERHALILDWFHKSLMPHSKADLEKALPTVASTNKMNIPDLVQALTDDGLVRVEKIGSGNWYWAFPSDARKGKEKVLGGLVAENEKLKTSIAHINQQIEDEMAQRVDDGDILEEDGVDREALMKIYTALVEQTGTISKELANYSESDPTEVLRKIQETRRLKESAERWTDNLEAIESYLKTMMDRREVAEIMATFCGDEYIAGEGLKEL